MIMHPVPGGRSDRLSVPARVTARRDLSADERATLIRVAEALIPPAGGYPGARGVADYQAWVSRAIAARAEHFEVLVTRLGMLAELSGAPLLAALRQMSTGDPDGFGVLSAVVAGAYLMAPSIRAMLGYPGQVRSLPRHDEAADQLSDGILDSVIARGLAHRDATG